MGSVVIDYTLYRNQGNDDSTWTEIQGFDYLSDGYVATVYVSLESMTAGKYYQFVYKATNMMGDSELTTVLSVPVADIPVQASAPTLVMHSTNTISIEWARVSNQ